jgi:hypothetical protein
MLGIFSSKSKTSIRRHEMTELEEKFVVMINAASLLRKQCYLDGKLFSSCDVMMLAIIKREILLSDLEVVQNDEKTFLLRIIEHKE